MKTFQRFWAAALMITVVAGLTGCCGISAKRQGIAFIETQPADRVVCFGKTAVFAVEAKGRGLAYQWYFEDEKGARPIPGANQARLEILDAQAANTGLYWCLIDSSYPRTGTKQTRTRSASLIVQAAIAVAGPEASILRSSAASTNRCTQQICGFLNYNNGGSGYKTPDASRTKCVAKLTDAAGAVVPSANYALMWRSSGTNFGCFADLSATEKASVFAPSTPYALTAYMKSGCVVGKVYLLTVNFVQP